MSTGADAWQGFVTQQLQKRMAEVKANMDILSVGDLLGMGYPDHQLGSQVRFTCPMHGDGTPQSPTGMLYIDEGRWRCFDCGGGGTIFDLPIVFGKVKDFPQALQWMEAHCGIVYEKAKPEPRKPGALGI